MVIAAAEAGAFAFVAAGYKTVEVMVAETRAVCSCVVSPELPAALQLCRKV